jgi:hypothetical protein
MLTVALPYLIIVMSFTLSTTSCIMLSSSILVSVAEYIKQLQSRAIMLNAEHQRLIDTIRKTSGLVQSGTALSVSGDEEEEEDNSTTTRTSLVLSRGHVASIREASCHHAAIHDWETGAPSAHDCDF